VGVWWRERLVRWRGFSELGGQRRLVVALLLFGGEDLEYIEAFVHLLVLLRDLSDSCDLQDVGFGDLFDAGSGWRA
jgi:hypothetical protein